MRVSLLAALLLTMSSLGATSSFAAIVAPDLALLQEQNRIKSDSEQRIQHDVLDPILGKGKASPFVDVEMEVKAESEESTREGMGINEKYKEKAPAASGGMQTTFVLPGIPKPKTITSQKETPEKPEQSQAQQAQQIKGVQEQRFAVNPVFKRMQVTVIHDDTVLKEPAQVELVRARIVDAMGQYKLAPDQISFRPTKFDKPPLVDWREDLKKPSVYLPLLYALLLLMFLSFLFGPLAKFFKQYVSALREKKSGEFEVLNKAENEDKGGEDDDGGSDEEMSTGALDVMVGQKPPEPPPEPPAAEEEDESMKKFEPFAYITEENFKRLGNLFLVRGDEPWLVAVVLTYLKPEIARATLTSLPVSLQARVAIEAMKIRQVTREQLMAIDADIKESVEFVVGGMERLTTLLDEADTMTRTNILEYLKNEKPEVYQRVRKLILTFDDVVSFQDRDMQTIVRELKTESMAKALQGAPPDVVNKFLSNMSTGAASLLKESIEYAQGLTNAQVEEERSKIMDVIKVLEKEGKVSVRQSRSGAFADFNEEVASERSEKYEPRTRAAEQAVALLLSETNAGPAAGPGGSPASAPAPVSAPAAAPQAAQAQPYMQAGVQSHDAGQFPQAAQYLEYALSLDGSLWQARQYLGNCYVQMGRTNDAIAQFEAVLAVNPDPGLRQWVDGMKTQAI
jgi:tetratricopeptide (TPR) repeat protein